MTAPAGQPTAARCGSGGSTHPQLDVALREAARQAVAGHAGMAADLGVVFVSSAHGTAIRSSALEYDITSNSNGSPLALRSRPSSATFQPASRSRSKCEITRSGESSCTGMSV